MDNDTTVQYLGGRLSDLFCLVRDEVVQIIGNSLGFGCSGDNGAFISLQDGQLSAATHNAKEGGQIA